MSQTIIEGEKEFLDDVETFYEQRGVPFERDGKVAGRPVSLHELFKTIVSMGGYDKVSGERMQWRTLVKPFGLGQQHEPAMTFQLKTLYYKNLAAYEIARYWGETPPPKEILEDLTAKGGDLRTRTLENYQLHGRNSTMNQDGMGSEDEELQRTPGKETPILEEPGSACRYPTRQLRQDPKRTQVYQPDPTSQRPRFPRTTSSPQASPAPPVYQAPYNHSMTADPRNPSFNIDKYEPRAPIALTLRPLVTPGNDPILYQQRKKAEEKSLPRVAPPPYMLDHLKTALTLIYPEHLKGPNIYVRCHNGIMSGVKEEQEFALHHLVKVSYERGDKFTFKGFNNLAEALLDKVLEISQLVYNIPWKVSYMLKEGETVPFTINGSFGTPKLLETIRTMKAVVEDLELESPELNEHLERILEAALVLRNMVTLEENAIFLSKIIQFRECLTIVINLPNQPKLNELRQYALEMAEMTTRYWTMEQDDSLYLSLVNELASTDRGRFKATIHAITRIAIETEQTFQLSHISTAALQSVISFFLLKDEELLEPCLDFIYEFTAIPDNVTALLKANHQLLPQHISQLSNLLLHNAVPKDDPVHNIRVPQKTQIPAPIPIIPVDLYMALLQYPEPDRASRWLRCCFEESPQDDITQIAIWQAYQTRFAQHGHIQAADFIKNVSTTFHQAQAQVIQAPTPRFIIKGIKPRRTLVDVQGRPFLKCLWEVPYTTSATLLVDMQGRQRHVCGSWYSSKGNLWNHVLTEHLSVQRGGDGKFHARPQPAEAPSTTSGTAAAVPKLPEQHKCCWFACPRASFTTAAELAQHLKIHMPESAESAAKTINDLATIPVQGSTPEHSIADQIALVRGKVDKEKLVTKHTIYFTATDSQGNPVGVPFMAAMVMRNVARYVGNHGGKVDLPDLHQALSGVAWRHLSEDDRRKELMERMFTTDVRVKLWSILAVAKSMVRLVTDLMGLIDKGESIEKKRQREEIDEDQDLDQNAYSE